MADTRSVHEGEELLTPEPEPEEASLEEPTLGYLVGLRRQMIDESDVLQGSRALRARLIEESRDPHPDASDCRWSWIEEASAWGAFPGALLSWIGIPKDEQCLNRPCFGGWIFEGDEPLECPVCLGTGSNLSREQREELEADPERMGG